MYYADEKIGWLQALIKTYESENFNQKIVEIFINMNLTFKMMGNEEKLIESTAEIKFSEIYQAGPPFILISYQQ